MRASLYLSLAFVLTVIAVALIRVYQEAPGAEQGVVVFHGGIEQ